MFTVFGGARAVGAVRLPQFVRPLYYRVRVQEAAATAAPAEAAPAPTASMPTAPAEPTAARTYTVSGGDSLWSIAQNTLGRGERWIDVWHLNRDRIGDPNLIFPGQELLISAAEIHRPGGTRPGAAISEVPRVIPPTTGGAPLSSAGTELKSEASRQAETLIRSLENLAASVAPRDVENERLQAYVSEAKTYAQSLAAATTTVGIVDAGAGLIDVTRDATSTAWTLFAEHAAAAPSETSAPLTFPVYRRGPEAQVSPPTATAPRTETLPVTLAALDATALGRTVGASITTDGIALAEQGRITALVSTTVPLIVEAIITPAPARERAEDLAFAVVGEATHILGTGSGGAATAEMAAPTASQATAAPVAKSEPGTPAAFSFADKSAIGTSIPGQVAAQFGAATAATSELQSLIDSTFTLVGDPGKLFGAAALGLATQEAEKSAAAERSPSEPQTMPRVPIAFHTNIGQIAQAYSFTTQNLEAVASLAREGLALATAAVAMQTGHPDAVVALANPQIQSILAGFDLSVTHQGVVAYSEHGARIAEEAGIVGRGAFHSFAGGYFAAPQSGIRGEAASPLAAPAPNINLQAPAGPQATAGAGTISSAEFNSALDAIGLAQQAMNEAQSAMRASADPAAAQALRQANQALGLALENFAVGVQNPNNKNSFQAAKEDAGNARALAQQVTEQAAASRGTAGLDEASIDLAEAVTAMDAERGMEMARAAAEATGESEGEAESSGLAAPVPGIAPAGLAAESMDIGSAVDKTSDAAEAVNGSVYAVQAAVSGNYKTTVVVAAFNGMMSSLAAVANNAQAVANIANETTAAPTASKVAAISLTGAVAALTDAYGIAYNLNQALMSTPTAALAGNPQALAAIAATAVALGKISTDTAIAASAVVAAVNNPEAAHTAAEAARQAQAVKNDMFAVFTPGARNAGEFAGLEAYGWAESTKNLNIKQSLEAGRETGVLVAPTTEQIKTEETGIRVVGTKKGEPAAPGEEPAVPMGSAEEQAAMEGGGRSPAQFKADLSPAVAAGRLSSSQAETAAGAITAGVQSGTLSLDQGIAVQNAVNAGNLSANAAATIGKLGTTAAFAGGGWGALGPDGFSATQAIDIGGFTNFGERGVGPPAPRVGGEEGRTTEGPAAPPAPPAVPTSTPTEQQAMEDGGPPAAPPGPPDMTPSEADAATGGTTAPTGPTGSPDSVGTPSGPTGGPTGESTS